MSLVPAAAPDSAEARGSNSLSLVCSEDVNVINGHSDKIAQAVETTSNAVREFLQWMNTKSGTAQWFREVAQLFSIGLSRSLEGKDSKYIQNVERTVWQIIENPGWILMDSNTTRNASKNERRIIRRRYLTHEAIYWMYIHFLPLSLC